MAHQPLCSNGRMMCQSHRLSAKKAGENKRAVYYQLPRAWEWKGVGHTLCVWTQSLRYKVYENEIAFRVFFLKFKFAFSWFWVLKLEFARASLCVLSNIHMKGKHTMGKYKHFVLPAFKKFCLKKYIITNLLHFYMCFTECIEDVVFNHTFKCLIQLAFNDWFSVFLKSLKKKSAVFLGLGA